MITGEFLNPLEHPLCYLNTFRVIDNTHWSKYSFEIMKVRYGKRDPDLSDWDLVAVFDYEDQKINEFIKKYESKGYSFSNKECISN